MQEAAYRRAGELDPTYAIPWYGLGMMYGELGELQEAADAFRQALNLDDTSGAAHASLASILAKLVQTGEAAEHLARARDLVSPEDSSYNRACLEALLGNYDTALDLLTAALESTPGARAWAARDPDLELLRGHPRFIALVAGDAYTKGNGH